MIPSSVGFHLQKYYLLAMAGTPLAGVFAVFEFEFGIFKPTVTGSC